MKQICGDCLHYYACAAWNIGSMMNTAAGRCVNYTPAAYTPAAYTPAADVKPIVRGKWEKGRQCGILGNEYKCSFCSYQIIMEEKDKYNYCPNCGADMRETYNG